MPEESTLVCAESNHHSQVRKALASGNWVLSPLLGLALCQHLRFSAEDIRAGWVLTELSPLSALALKLMAARLPGEVGQAKRGMVLLNCFIYLFF